jgi:hypothetical protein
LSVVSPNPTPKQLRGQIGGHTSWSHTTDRTARTQAARDAALARFMPEDPDGTLTDEQRRQMAISARKAEMSRLALLSAQARAKAAAERKAQGLPPTIDNPDALRTIAAVLVQHADHIERRPA